MRTFDIEILIVPGFTNSGPDHWQTRWESRLKTSRRVQQADWERPDVSLWTQQLINAIAAAQKPVVIVAHSCGVPTVAHAAAKLHDDRVVGAFLVAPASEDVTAGLPGVDPAFTPYPRDPLPFPSLLVASRNDPYCPYDAAGDMALNWGSTLVDAGDVGHLNTASGHGPWPEGAMRFGWFLKQLGGAKTV
jgi:uncharacterized protein